MRTGWVAAVIVLSLSLIGCAGPAPSKKDVVGTWTSRDGSRLHFASDGTFTFENVPLSAISDWESKARISGLGRWSLEHRTPEESAFREGRNCWQVEVVFPSASAGGGDAEDICFAREGRKAILSFDVGDPDSGATLDYEKNI
jgi:hypothetical protein